MNSTSDIIDELDVIKNNINVINNKLKKTIDDILQRNIQNIEDVLDSKVINIYARPWSKLEHKLKLKKIDEYFFNTEICTYGDEDKKFAIRYSNDKKKVSLDYDVSLCEITKLQLIRH